MSDKPEASKDAAKPEGAVAGQAPAASGGIKAFLPLIIATVLMPVVAVVTTKFLIIPKVVRAQESAQPGGEEPAEGEAEGGHGEKAAGGHEAKPEAGHGPKKEEGHEKKEGKGTSAKGAKKQSFQIAKIIVNVSGTAGTRYLMISATLVGGKPDFKELLEENKDQVLDLTISSLSTKTIADLEKPGARNQIRSELISIYNNAFGVNLVQEIYFTEFAIQ